jgi:predicted membrane GTPase involved in stress response
MYHAFDELRERKKKRGKACCLIDFLLKRYRAGSVRDYPGRPNGVLISNSAGSATAYSLDKLQARGKLFVSPGQQL